MESRTEMSSFQLTFFLIHAQVGVGIITLPYDVFVHAKTDAWISILLTGIIIQIVILLYGILIRRFPNYTLYDICIYLFGKIFGKVFIILIIISYISAAIIIMAQFAYLLKTWMMPLTPKWVLIALLGVTTFIIVKENIQVIARFTVLSSVFFTGFIIAYVIALPYADIKFILPIGSSGATAITKGIVPSIFSFHGFEVLLLIYPFVKATPKHIVKAASISNVFITLFYTIITAITLAFFSAEELKIIPEPVLYLVSSFSTRVIERPDLIFTSMWIVFVATSLMIIIYVSSIGTLAVMNATNLRNYAFIIILICFLLSLTFSGQYQIDYLAQVHYYITTPILCGLPLITLITSLFLRKGKGVHDE